MSDNPASKHRRKPSIWAYADRNQRQQRAAATQASRVRNVCEYVAFAPHSFPPRLHCVPHRLSRPPRALPPVTLWSLTRTSRYSWHFQSIALVTVMSRASVAILTSLPLLHQTRSFPERQTMPMLVACLLAHALM